MSKHNVISLQDRESNSDPLTELLQSGAKQCFRDRRETTALARPFPGAGAVDTQQLLDQLTGADSILDHLPDGPEDADERWQAVQRYWTSCVHCSLPGWTQDTVLPWKLDSDRPLPPVLRLNKLIGNDNLSAITETLVIRRPGLPDVTYSLLAVVYGSGRHFTADIRYNMNAGSKVFFHYDPFTSGKIECWHWTSVCLRAVGASPHSFLDTALGRGPSSPSSHT